MISVLTPTLNYARFLKDAILSVRLQEGVTVEHIVQDGGSTDGTIELLGRYPWVRWESAADEGQSDALNKALRRAKGDWIAWLNADEFLLPGGLAHLLRKAQATGADVVYGDCIFIDGTGNILRLKSAHTFNRFVLWHYGAFIPSCAVLIRRSLLDKDPWNISVDLLMDWQLYIDLALRGARFVWEPYPVGAFRVHAEQITAKDRSEFSSSYRLMRALYNARPSALHYRVGEVLHGFLKLKDGCYLREYCVRAFRGHNLRWFEEEEGKEVFQRVVGKCYGKMEAFLPG